MMNPMDRSVAQLLLQKPLHHKSPPDSALGIGPWIVLHREKHVGVAADAMWFFLLHMSDRLSILGPAIFFSLSVPVRMYIQ